MYGYKKLKKTKKNRWFLIVLTLLVLVLCGAGIYTWKFHTKTANPIAQNPTNSPSEKDLKDSSAIDSQNKQNFIDSQKSGSNNQAAASGDASSNGTNSQSTVAAKLESNGSVTIVSKLFGISDGTCNLKLTNGNHVISKSASVIYQAEFSTCAGFSINPNELVAGEWAVQLTVVANSKNQSFSTTVQVK